MNSPLTRLAHYLQRADGWINAWTGLGTGRDKTTAGRFENVVPLTDAELSWLYNGDPMAAKIVDTPPRQMLRQGFTVTDKDQGAATAVQTRARVLDVRTKLEEGHIWGRTFGGAVVMIGADDGQDSSLPLDETRIKSLDFLQVYDRRQVYPQTFHKNTRSPKYGEPAVYRITPYDGTESYVHETRLILCRGAFTGLQERRTMNHWDYSVLQRPYDTLRQFWANHKAAEHMMTDASQAVLKLKGLFSQIASGDLTLLQTRAQFLDLSRSVARAVLLDADSGESLEKIQTAFAGVPDMLAKSAQLLAAVSGIPVTIIMGQAPAGLNATGDSDIRNFYDTLQVDRELILRPDLERLIHLIALSLGIRSKPGIEFPPLWQETRKEEAEREKLEADTDNVRIQSQVLTPEEVALARYSGDKPRRPKIDALSRAAPPALPPEQVPGALQGTGAALSKPAPTQTPGAGPGAV